MNVCDITGPFRLPENDPAMWIGLFLDSYRNDLRLSGRFQDADKMRRIMQAAGLPVSDVPLEPLREFQQEYGKRRGKAGSTLVDLEIF